MAGPGQKSHMNPSWRRALSVAFRSARGLQIPPAFTSGPHLPFHRLARVKLLACVSCTVVGAVLGGPTVSSSGSLGVKGRLSLTCSVCVCACVYVCERVCSRAWASLSATHLLLKTCSSRILLDLMFLAHVAFTPNDFALGVKDSPEENLPSAKHETLSASASSAL